MKNFKIHRIWAFLMIFMIVMTLVPSGVFADTTPQIKNIIYMIADGGGYSPYDLANMVKIDGGFDRTVCPNATVTEASPMTLRDYLAGSAITAPYPATSITDSAAAGTAMSTGKKARNGRIGLDVNDKPVANLLEAAESVGKSTGLVATYHWAHATPATFSAHSKSRNTFYDIYQQVENKGIEVVLGVGYGAVSEYATIQNAIDRGYKIVKTKDELSAVQPGEKIWGNYPGTNIPFDYRKDATTGSLADMTQAAITALSADEDGFFLMVEGSKVDSGGHGNDAVYATSEYLAFDAAFKVALDFAKGRNDTVIVATADHDTGGMIIPSDVDTAIEQIKKAVNPSSISWTATEHTGQNVPVWVYVPEGVSVVNGLNSTLGDTDSTRTNYVIDNTAIAPWCADFMGVDLDELTSELFVDVTDIGVYMEDTEKFIFNNGNKYAVMNQSVYYKDGQAVSMGYKEVFTIDGRVYAPAEIIDEDDWNYVTDNYDGITGSGSKSDPYVLNDSFDFIEFTDKVIKGDTYSGKYIRQDADIDLAGNSNYTGMGSSCTFAGTYDGEGHTLNVTLSSTADQSVFPNTSGKIMNLGITGSVTTGEEVAAGICSSLLEGGKMVNCWSTARVTSGSSSASGLAASNYGIIENCYFGGTVLGTTVYPIGVPEGSGTFKNCYYTDACGGTQTKDGITEVTDEAAKSTLAETLNAGRSDAAATAIVSEDDISWWTNEEGYPVHFIPEPIVSHVTVTPRTATVDKGGCLQLVATVEGMYNYSHEVFWTIEEEVTEGTYVDDNGYLEVSVNETIDHFTVMAKSAGNGAIAGICRVTVENALATEPKVTGVDIAPQTATVDKGDGLQLVASVQGELGCSKKVLWTISGNTSDDTYIADDGFIFISPDEQASEITVMARSMRTSAVTDTAVITVGENVLTEPDGSRARPYLIGTAAEFKEFYSGMESGSSCSGVYYKQTADIDLADDEEYYGLGEGYTFGGVYDGAGHTINLAIRSQADGCLFPETSGKIMNLGTTGIVSNAGVATGICRTVLEGGKMINCWSTADITSDETACGLTFYNYGAMEDCHFSGTIAGSSSADEYPIAAAQGTSYSFLDCYYTTNVILGVEDLLDATEYPGIATQVEFDNIVYTDLIAVTYNFSLEKLDEWLGIGAEFTRTKNGETAKNRLVANVGNLFTGDGGVEITFGFTGVTADEGTFTALPFYQKYHKYTNISALDTFEDANAEDLIVESGYHNITAVFERFDSSAYTWK